VRRAQTIADVVAIALAMSLLTAAPGLQGGGATDFLVLGAVLLPCWVALSSVHRLHLLDEQRADHSSVDDFARIFEALVVAVFVAGGLEIVLGVPGAPTLGALLAVVAVTYPVLVGMRALARAAARRHHGYVQRAIVVGAGDVGRLLASKLEAHPEYGIEFVGFVEPSFDGVPPAGPLDEVLGALGDAERVVTSLGIDRAFIAFSLASDREVADAARRLEDLGVQVDIVPRLYDLVGPRADFHTVEGLPMVGLPDCRPSRGIVAAKRAFDVVVAGVGLLVVSPILAVIALRVRADSPGPILYRGQRCGAGGQRFELLKFRTMPTHLCRGEEYGGPAAEAAFAALMADPSLRAEFERSHKLRADPRVTRFGSWLRRSSLDELPQLVNVLRGDMTLVGPRAITTDEWAQMSPERRDPERGPQPYWKIGGLRPGVTGWWQIHGRSDAVFEERVRLDATYASSRSLRLDLLILARTIRIVFSRAGSY
jgi:exopolysaccharide biosynthesis polyprenyl glycosylphosphotransferase